MDDKKQANNKTSLVFCLTLFWNSNQLNYPSFLCYFLVHAIILHGLYYKPDSTLKRIVNATFGLDQYLRLSLCTATSGNRNGHHLITRLHCWLEQEILAIYSPLSLTIPLIIEDNQDNNLHGFHKSTPKGTAWAAPSQSPKQCSLCIRISLTPRRQNVSSRSLAQLPKNSNSATWRDLHVSFYGLHVLYIWVTQSFRSMEIVQGLIQLQSKQEKNGKSSLLIRYQVYYIVYLAYFNIVAVATKVNSFSLVFRLLTWILCGPKFG